VGRDYAASVVRLHLRGLRIGFAALGFCGRLSLALILATATATATARLRPWSVAVVTVGHSWNFGDICIEGRRGKSGACAVFGGDLCWKALDRYVSGLTTSAKVNGSRHKRVEKLLSAETRKKKLEKSSAQADASIQML
jgi:hypothetical protein